MSDQENNNEQELQEQQEETQNVSEPQPSLDE